MTKHEEAVEAYKKVLDYCTYRSEECPETFGKNFCEGCPFLLAQKNWQHCFVMNGTVHTKAYSKEYVENNLKKLKQHGEEQP